jgi:hypothetical protein
MCCRRRGSGAARNVERWELFLPKRLVGGQTGDFVLSEFGLCSGVIIELV